MSSGPSWCWKKNETGWTVSALKDEEMNSQDPCVGLTTGSPSWAATWHRFLSEATNCGAMPRRWRSNATDSCSVSVRSARFTAWLERALPLAGNDGEPATPPRTGPWQVGKEQAVADRGWLVDDACSYLGGKHGLNLDQGVLRNRRRAPGARTSDSISRSQLRRTTSPAHWYHEIAGHSAFVLPLRNHPASQGFRQRVARPQMTV